MNTPAQLQAWQTVCRVTFFHSRVDTDTDFGASKHTTSGFNPSLGQTEEATVFIGTGSQVISKTQHRPITVGYSGAVT